MDTPPSLTHRYGTGARLFHWTTALLVLAAFVLSTGGPEARVYAPERAASLAIHETLGLAVLVLTALRFAWRLVEAHPEPEPIAPWMRMASRLVEGCLLVLLIFVPLSAIAGAWLEGHGVSLVGVGLLGPWTDSRMKRGLGFPSFILGWETPSFGWQACTRSRLSTITTSFAIGFLRQCCRGRPARVADRRDE